MADCRPIETEDEIASLCRTLAECFSGTEERVGQWLESAGRENWRVVDGRAGIAGGLLVIPMGQWFGGRSVPTIGIAGVGIAPEQRAQGAAARLMIGMVREARENGVALSTLYPSTTTLYRRAGYELAGCSSKATLPTRAIGVRDEELEVTAASRADDDTIAALMRERGRLTNGNLDRGPYIWDRSRESREGRLREYLIRRGDDVQGYVSCLPVRAGGEWSLFCRDVVALTPAAARRILTLFTSHRAQLPNVSWFSHTRDPLLFLCPDPVYKLELVEPWMLRLVNVAAALEARGYPAGLETEVHLDVADDVLAENAGRCVLRVADGSGRVEPGGNGDVRVDVRGLAALYSGYMGPHGLRAATALDASSEDDARLAAIFAGPAPWMAQTF